MILNMQEKLRNQQIKHENQLEAVNEDKKLEIDVSQSLRKDLKTKEKSIKSYEQTIKVIIPLNKLG